MGWDGKRPLGQLDVSMTGSRRVVLKKEITGLK